MAKPWEPTSTWLKNRNTPVLSNTAPTMKVKKSSTGLRGCIAIRSLLECSAAWPGGI